jgi:hypothetical protein
MGITNFFSNYRAKKRIKKGLKNEGREWVARQYASPSLAHIKRAVLLRLGFSDAIWVETGTFMGDTAALLANNAKAVYTIEPDRVLYEKAAARFSSSGSKVKALHGLSEEVFPSLLPTLSGTVNFWLDGHYSGGITHQGPTDCPVRDELQNIENNLSRYAKVAVLIDDVRCFDPSNPEYSDYPSLDYLVDWARKNNLVWHIEHDIFVAKSKAVA